MAAETKADPVKSSSFSQTQKQSNPQNKKCKCFVVLIICRQINIRQERLAIEKFLNQN